MNVFQKFINIFKTDDIIKTEKKGYYETVDIRLDGPLSLLSQAFYGADVVSPTLACRYYRENAAIATSIDMIGEAIEQIKPVLRIDGEYISDHEVINLLTNPNGFNDYKEFMGSMSRYYLLTHNSYVMSLGNYKFPPLELYSINPLNVNIYSNIDSYPDSYFINNTVSNGRYSRMETPRNDLTRFVRQDTMLSELYHIMGFSSLPNNNQADSPLTAILGEIKHMIEGNKHNTSLLRNSGRPSMWIDFKDGPNDEELLNRRQHIYETITGAENAGLPMVTGSDAPGGTDTEINVYGTNNKDMDYAKLNEFANLTVYNRLGIPLPLITLKASTFNNIQNAIVFFYERTVIPNINTILGGLTKFLIPKYKDLSRNNAVITFNPDDIAPLMTKRLEEIKLRSEIGVETANELRSMMPDREDIDGGDVLIVNSSDKSSDDDEVLKEKINRDIEKDKG